MPFRRVRRHRLMNLSGICVYIVGDETIYIVTYIIVSACDTVKLCLVIAITATDIPRKRKQLQSLLSEDYGVDYPVCIVGGLNFPCKDCAFKIHA